MCKISNYPEWYIKANETLRREGINPEIPGYEFLRRAIVVYKVEGKIPKEELLKEVKKGMLIPANDNQEQKKGRDEVEQWMVEAIRSVGIEKISAFQYVMKLSNKIVET